MIHALGLPRRQLLYSERVHVPGDVGDPAVQSNVPASRSCTACFHLTASARSLTDPGSPAQDRSHGLAGQGLFSHSVGPARPAAGVHAPLARGR